MKLFNIFFFWLFTATAFAAPNGESLFADHCSACHGATGEGGVGVPLALPSFLAGVDDDFLRKTIRLGRPGRVMPAFPKLSDAQLDAIVGHIRGWSGKPAPVFSDKPVAGDAARGKGLYKDHCARCHGKDGEGGKGTGVTFSRDRELPIVAPALNNQGFLAAASDAMIRHTLENGREGTPMDSFLDDGLSRQDLDNLVSYVRSFADTAQSVAKQALTREDAIISVESAYSLEETVENLKAALAGQNYILIRTDTLEHGLVPDGKENPKQVILHFCNFKFLFDALAVDPRVGMFLPCRVTVTEQGGKVLVSAINPLYLSRLFNNDELDEFCSTMHESYREIIEDATL